MATQQWKYHVFISFRGEDTRLNFVCHLDNALRRTGLNTFVDNRLRRGEEINTALLQAIQDSKVALIIFSENYASSSWCLDELLKIIECHETHDQIVIPVFYRVNPSDVRKQNGSFEESFANHSKTGNNDKIQKWKDAATKAANISGWDSNVIREEDKLIDLIVRDALEKLKLLDPCSLKGFVGLDSKISQVKKLLATGSSDVRMLGIWGMGGIGKTTLAEAIFDQVSSQFEGRCLVRKVRETWEKGREQRLLEQLFSELLEERNVKIYTTTVGPGLLFVERLKSKRVFVVFDDVTDRSQLKYLIGNECRFGAGSNIIITSRDKQVFEGITDNIYEVEALSDTESHQLFVWNAFKQEQPSDPKQKQPSDPKQKQPSDDHIPLIGAFVNYARGNPLAIKVLGSCVGGDRMELWEEALTKLSNCPNEDIHNVLKLSYDRLDRQERAIFLHIACFFKGENVNKAKGVFTSCGLSANIGVSHLVGKSLVTISEYDELDMHDLLQEMGREIVRQESNDPRRRSRLWDAEEIRRVFEENEGIEAIEIQSIILNTTFRDDIILDPDIFRRMPNLKFLRFYTFLGKRSKLLVTKRLRFLPSELRYLYWDGYPEESLPTDFDAKELIVLDLPNSNFKQILKDGGKLKGVAQSLIESPLMSRVIDIVFGIGNKVPSPSCRFLSKITHMDMEGCQNLKSFPNNVDLQCLEILNLTGCSNLKIFPEISTNLIKLYVGGTTIKEVHSSSIEGLSRLEELNMESCEKLESLPSNICQLQALRILDLKCCLSLKKFPEILEPMEKLKTVDLSFSAIEAIPSSIDNMKWLKSLGLSRCSIRKLPKDIGSLCYLRQLDLTSNKFVKIPASIKQLSLLESLGLNLCPRLRSLPQLPPSLCRLTVVHCKSLKTLLAFKQPIFNGCKMDFKDCFKLEEKECEAMAYKLLRNGQKDVCLRYPGSRITEWFRYQTTGDIIRIKLPSNWFLNHRFFGFAFCTVLKYRHTRKSMEFLEFECYFENNYNPTILFQYKGRFHQGFPAFIGSPPKQQHVLVWCVHNFNVWISERRESFYFHCINMASFKFFIRGHVKIKKCGITPLYMQVDEGCSGIAPMYMQVDDDEGYVQGGGGDQDDANENAYWMLGSSLYTYHDEDMKSEDTDDDMIPENDEDEFFETKDGLSGANDELSETASNSD